jgi:drug/metabolite transporter (DMT)-like permease
MLAVLLALASAAGFGGSDYAAGLAARRASVIRITILAEAVSVVFLILVLPLAGLRAPSLASLGWGAAGGLSGGLGALALYAGFRHAAFSVVGPLSAIGAAGFSVLAGLLLGERPGMLAMIGIALALPAIVGVSASPGSAGPGSASPGSASPGSASPGSGSPGKFSAGPAGPDAEGSGQAGPARSAHHAAGVTWGLAAGAGFAVLFIALNRAGAGSGLWPVAAAQVAALIAVAVLGAATGQALLPPKRARWLATLTGLAGAAGTILYFYATHAGLLAVTAVLTSLYPAVTIVLARVFLGERLTAIRLAGLCLAAASVGLIAIAGSA